MSVLSNIIVQVPPECSLGSSLCPSVSSQAMAALFCHRLTLGVAASFQTVLGSFRVLEKELPPVPLKQESARTSV